MAPRQLNQESPWLLALLAALIALGPLSVDMYLPAMPIMMAALDTDISSMHLTLSAYLTGFAIFHLLCGPLADRFGRKPILTAGTLLFIVACLGCAQATTVSELLAFRFLQGVGACVGPTLARTVARDIYGPTKAARALSLMAMMMALAPAIAPILGGFLLLVLPWPSIFVFLASYGALMILMLQVYLPESLPQRQSLHPRAILANYRQLIVDPLFLSVTFAGGMVYAGLMVYLSCSSFVYIDMLGVPVEYYGFIFLTSVVGYIIGSGFSAKLSQHYDSEQTMLLGSVLVVVATTVMCLGGWLWPQSITALALPMTLYAIGMGLVLPHAMTIALRPFPHIAGTASALLGFIQMALSASASALVGQFLDTTPAPMLLSMLVIAALGLALSGSAYAHYLSIKP